MTKVTLNSSKPPQPNDRNGKSKPISPTSCFFLVFFLSGRCLICKHGSHVTRISKGNTVRLQVGSDGCLVYQVRYKVFPCSLSSVGPRADPGVHAVSPQVTLSSPPGGRLPLLSARPAVTRSHKLLLLRK